jgi:mannose-6-phosphate isomerase-like protein (cupin superfamily)
MNLIVRRRDDHDAFEDGPDRGRVIVFGRDTGGAYGLMEWTVAPVPEGPAAYGAHLHRGCEETFRVLSGRLDFLLDETVVTLEAGDFVRVPPGVLHGYANRSGAPVELLVSFHPGGLEELFLKYRSDGGDPAGAAGFMAEAAGRFGSEFGLD